MHEMNVLVSLYKGYGLGDSVQVSVILQHLVKHRPSWIIDYQAEEGKHQVGRGIINGRTFAHGQEPPNPKINYDAYVQITLYDKYVKYTDRPNTHIVSCLKDQLAINWDVSCGRYKVDISSQADFSASMVVPRKAVAIHYQGKSCSENKNLTHEQASRICDVIKRIGYIPLLIDWNDTSPVRHEPQTISTGGYDWSLAWGSLPEMNCAVISRCSAFIGIDSGPAKCASATNTPSLVVWTKHHPVKYHDPADNTTHLIPVNHSSLLPEHNREGVIDWFNKNYNTITYDTNLIPKITNWLLRTLT